MVGRSIEYSDTKPPPKPLRNPFVLFTYLDVLTLLFFNGIIYAVFYGVTATISELFETAYPSLNQTDVASCSQFACKIGLLSQLSQDYR